MTSVTSLPSSFLTVPASLPSHSLVSQRLAGTECNERGFFSRCSLPHVDSCELLSSLALKHYSQEVDFAFQPNNSDEMCEPVHKCKRAPVSAHSPNFTAHMPQLSQMRLRSANLSPNQNPFQDALFGL